MSRETSARPAHKRTLLDLARCKSLIGVPVMITVLPGLDRPSPLLQAPSLMHALPANPTVSFGRQVLQHFL